MKIYTRPNHIIDTAFVVFKFDEGKLSIERHQFASMIVLGENSIAKSLEGFEQVDATAFNHAALMNCTGEDVGKFIGEYGKLFK